MHIAAKLTLGVGVGMLLIGILLGGLGARAAGSVEDFSVEEDEVWNGSSGQYIHKDTSEWGLLIFVRDEVRCDEFEVNVSVVSSDTDGKVWYEADYCIRKLLSADERLLELNGLSHLKNVPLVFWLSATIPDGFLHLISHGYDVRAYHLSFDSQYQITREIQDPIKMDCYAYSDANVMFQGLKQHICEKIEAPTIIYAQEPALIKDAVAEYV